MSVIDAKANSIAGRMGVSNKTGQATFDPAVILAVLSAVGDVIIKVVQSIASCNNQPHATVVATDSKTKKAVAAMAVTAPLQAINSPNLLHRAKLDVMCRASLIRNGVPMKYQYLANDMKASFIEEGKEVSQDDYDRMLSEVASLGNQENPWSF